MFESVVELHGNADVSRSLLTFTVKETSCGRSELVGAEHANWVISSKTPLSDGVIEVSVVNPDSDKLAWVDNRRIHTMSLLYRLRGAQFWLTAASSSGTDLAFFDDVRVVALCCYFFD